MSRCLFHICFIFFCVALCCGVPPLTDTNRRHQPDRYLADGLQMCKAADLVGRPRVDGLSCQCAATAAEECRCSNAT